MYREMGGETKRDEHHPKNISDVDLSMPIPFYLMSGIHYNDKVIYIANNCMFM